MLDEKRAESTVRFGPFELSVGTGELRKNGLRLKLSGQPIKVLTLLVAHPGQLVPREELQRCLWPGNSFGDFETGLNAAVNRLRDYLDDSAAEPKYIETVQGRGYRFIGKLEESNRDVGPGKTVSHYQVLETIGRGGMGVVYKGQDLRLRRHVALKFLPKELTTNPDALKRFRREASAASSLNHPNICTIYEIDVFEGQDFIAMELLKGKTLRDRIEDSPIPLDEVVNFAIQTASALEAAHGEGIIRRDIKPANIFVTSQGPIKLLDFGLAKLTSEASKEALDPTATTVTDAVIRDIYVTMPGALVGTVAYMSPEQARGEQLDLRTDLFSFGTVLCEMVAGQPPFTGDCDAAVRNSILYEHPLQSLRASPRHPPGLLHIINKALQKDRRLRYRAASDMRSDLVHLKHELEWCRTAAKDRPSTGIRKMLAVLPFENLGESVVFTGVGSGP